MSGPSHLGRALAEARARLGGSVTWINPEAERRADPSAVRVGLKDTDAIPAAVARRLTEAEGYLWLTLDRASPGGRAVDTGLINPLTGRPMTGSSSGGAVNVLEGINDIAVGTDGGGSVLGPAMACNLYGLLGSGLGLTGEGEGLSTDGRSFVPGLGLIARSLEPAFQALDLLLGEPLAAPLLEPGERDQVLAGIGQVVVPAAQSLVRPDGLEMLTGLEPALRRLSAAGIGLRPIPMGGADERGRALEILAEAGQDPVLTLEGPVDWFGLGDSVLGSLGSAAAAEQARSGKYLLLAANMAGATAVALPVGLVSSGFLIIAPPGRRPAQQALALAALLDGAWPVPDLVRRYFGPERRRRPGFRRPEGPA